MLKFNQGKSINADKLDQQSTAGSNPDVERVVDFGLGAFAKYASFVFGLGMLALFMWAWSYGTVKVGFFLFPETYFEQSCLARNPDLKIYYPDCRPAEFKLNNHRRS